MPNGYTNWCGTRQLGEEPDMEAWLRHLFESGKAKFIIGQVEQGSHLHLQFYIQREKRVSLANMKREICNVTHWEPARGSAEDNIKYCSKESTRVSGPWQFGEYTTQGQRTDLDKAARMIDEGRTLREVAVECKSTFIRHHKGLRAYEAIIRSKGPRKIVKMAPKSGSSGAQQEPGSPEGPSTHGQMHTVSQRLTSGGTDTTDKTPSSLMTLRDLR